MPSRSKNSASARSPRADGDATRARILEVAGRQFALNGYAATTSKAICEAAETNMAAVNYHFGGREGLMAAVHAEVHSAAGLDLPFLERIASSDMPVEEKLDQLVDAFCANISPTQLWRNRLWARELMDPTQQLSPSVQAEVGPKLAIIERIMVEAIGVPPADLSATFGVYALTTPILVFLIMPYEVLGPTQVMRQAGSEWVATRMKAYVRGGIAALRQSLKSSAPKRR